MPRNSVFEIQQDSTPDDPWIQNPAGLRHEMNRAQTPNGSKTASKSGTLLAPLIFHALPENLLKPP